MDLSFPEQEFDWDAHNIRKNRVRHGVEYTEAEEVFLDCGIRLLPDPTHSASEERYIVLGKTKTERCLFVAFIRRKGRIRVISARDMSKKERKVYYEKNE